MLRDNTTYTYNIKFMPLFGVYVHICLFQGTIIFMVIGLTVCLQDYKNTTGWSDLDHHLDTKKNPNNQFHTVWKILHLLPSSKS